MDTYESHEGNLYCKPHFKSLFAPKVVEEDDSVRKYFFFVVTVKNVKIGDDIAARPRKNELIIRENQPEELPPDVVRGTCCLGVDMHFY